jgi:DNA-binding transcriptional MocR family regulator
MERVQSSAVRDLLKYSKIPGIISLAGGIPAPDLFDIAGLQAALWEVTDGGDPEAFQYGMTEGDPLLRDAIARLLRSRGIDVEAANILVTSGSQQGLDLAARVLLDPGDTVLVERPSYLAALQVFGLAEANIVSVPADAGGMDVSWIERYLTEQSAKAIYVVPNFGNPSGNTLPFQRRQQLAALAARRDIFIIEDDPYGELRLSGRPVSSIYEIGQGSPAQRRIIYLSSFSKILAPGLRTGWMVLPDQLLQQAALAKQAIDLHTCSLSQRLITRYLAGGRLPARLERLTQAYRERRDALSQALRRHLSGEIEFNEPDGGMFLWARFAPDIDAAQVLKTALELGVIFVPGAVFYADDPERNTLRLSYSTITAELADAGAERLARALRTVHRKSAPR